MWTSEWIEKDSEKIDVDLKVLVVEIEKKIW